MAKKEAIVVGLGISGCAAARLLADSGYEVMCFEKESHIGGSLFEDNRPNGIRVQIHGPHIFHTDSESVYQFLRFFGSFYPYRHRVLGKIDDKVFPLPLNANSLEILFGTSARDKFLARLLEVFPDKRRVSVDELIASSDSTLMELGRFMIDHILVQDLNLKAGSSFVPADDSYSNLGYVDIGNDDCFYEDKYQAMPLQGFTALMDNMLSHPAITTYLNMDAMSRLAFSPNSSTILLDGIPFNGKVIFTAALDYLFDFCYGTLSFRTSNLTFKDISADFSEEAAVIVTPDSKECARISESKHITLQDLSGETSICMESAYHSAINGIEEPFEPVRTKENLELYQKYLSMIQKYPSVYLLGRLANFNNYSISESIEEAMVCIASMK